MDGEATLAHQHHNSIIPLDDIIADIQAVLWSLRLHSVRRYFHQRFWEEETRAAEFADRVETGMKLENVSAHSWHVADTVILLGPHFGSVNRQRAVELAILHDKLEIITGDLNPFGRDGSGTNSHAFSTTAQKEKLSGEITAARIYAQKLRPGARHEQLSLFEELFAGKSEEARFVKAVDKLQSFAFVHTKKDGDMRDNHIISTLRYASKIYQYYPPLQGHHDVLRRFFLCRIAERRGCEVGALDKRIFGQLELPV